MHALGSKLCLRSRQGDEGEVCPDVRMLLRGAATSSARRVPEAGLYCTTGHQRRPAAGTPDGEKAARSLSLYLTRCASFES